jgi:hypothetical protein
MNVRAKAFVQTFGSLAAIIGVLLLLDFFFPKYGITIYLSAVGLYIVWCMYKIRVGMLTREQEKIVNILKE